MKKWMEVVGGDMRKTYEIDVDVVKGEGKDPNVKDIVREFLLDSD